MWKGGAVPAVSSSQLGPSLLLSFVLMTSRHDLVYLGLSHMVLAGPACFEGVEEQIQTIWSGHYVKGRSLG